MKTRKDEQYTDEEIERRALEMIQRSFALPHKSQKEFVGKTPRARAIRDPDHFT